MSFNKADLNKAVLNKAVLKKVIPYSDIPSYYPVGHDDYIEKQAFDRMVNYDFKGANKAIGLIENKLSYLFFIDTLPSEYLSTEFSQCIRLESKLSALESQIGTMPDGPKKDKLLARVESSLKYLEFKKERIIGLEIKFQDEDYDQQLEMIRNYFKKSEAEFKYFIKEQKEFQNHLKNEFYWDRLLEVLGEYGSCYENMYADSISDLELLKLIFVNTNNVLSPEFEGKFLKTLEQDDRFDAFYINQKMDRLKDNPVKISVKLDKNALMQEGIEQHILIYQHEGKEVRFNLRRDRAANGLHITQIDEPLMIENKDYEFLSLYANQNIGLKYARSLEASPKSLLELSENNFKESSKENSEDFAFETN